MSIIVQYLANPELRTSLYKYMLTGFIFSLILITFFTVSVENPDPDWGKWWIVRPLIITPLAGAMGGAFFHFMHFWGKQNKNFKAVATVIGLAGFFVALWLGSILGLAGTLWN